VEGYFSNWRSVISTGASVVCNTYKRFGGHVGGLISKFADDTKNGGIGNSEENCQRIEQDINQLETWGETWQMEFNPDQCGVKRFGRSTAEECTQ